MTRWRAFWVMSMAVILYSCAQGIEYRRILDPVGPGLGSGDEGTRESSLMVYTDTEWVNRGDSGQYYPHRPYDILTLEGQRVRRVLNHDSPEDETPTRVSLRPGVYVVRGPGRGQWWEVVVHIEPERTTTVMLDGNWTPPLDSPSRIIARLEDGTAIGWHARARSRIGKYALRYEGSSTVGMFIREAASSGYTAGRVIVDTSGESEAGKTAVLGVADLAGVAGAFRELPSGVECEVIGYDHLAVVVNRASPFQGITTSQLKDIYAGRVRSWKEINGPDVEIVPLVATHGSNARAIFEDRVIRHDGKVGVIVGQDQDIVRRAGANTGVIGYVSAGLALDHPEVRMLSLDGQVPAPHNPDYPLARPLHLCIREETGGPARQFYQWAISEKGQGVVASRFVPQRLVADSRAGAGPKD